MCSNLYGLFSKRIDLISNKFFNSSAVEKKLFFKLSVRLFIFSNKEVDFS